MAIVAVSAIVISGIANTAFRVGGNVGMLAATLYGEILFVNLGMVTAMLFLAAFNRFMLMPCMDRATGKTDVLRQSLIGETILGLLVLGAASVLGITPPPQ